MWSCGRWEKLNKLKTTARVQSCRPSHSWCFCLVSLKTFGPFHIWHAECVKVQTQRSIHGRTQFTSESVYSRRTEWVSSSCERARLKLLLGDLWVTTCWFPEERLGLTGKHTHTHTGEATHMWTTQDHEQQHYFTREAAECQNDTSSASHRSLGSAFISTTAGSSWRENTVHTPPGQSVYLRFLRD